MKRLTQVLLIVTFIGFSWLGMQVVHETGHVLVARLTGGEVIKVALHPLIVSRTDLGQNPHPLAVVWGGPLIGSGLPLLVLALAAAFRWPGLPLFRFFAGFCLIANGVYIGIGWLLADGADPLSADETTTVSSEPVGMTFSNVDLAKETVASSNTQLAYDLALRAVGDRFGLLRTAIRGS